MQTSGSGGRRSETAGGKSEQGRARWWLTATRSDPRDSATENTPPMALRLGCGVAFATPITLLLVRALYLIVEDMKSFFDWLFNRTQDEEVETAA